MMDYLQAIGTVGFPIVAYLLLFIRQDRTIRDNTKAIKEMITIMRSK